jgi:hypothetical protein
MRTISRTRKQRPAWKFNEPPRRPRPPAVVEQIVPERKWPNEKSQRFKPRQSARQIRYPQHLSLIPLRRWAARPALWGHRHRCMAQSMAPHHRLLPPGVAPLAPATPRLKPLGPRLPASRRANRRCRKKQWQARKKVPNLRKRLRREPKKRRV